MRRIRTLVLLAGVMSLLIGPSATPSAQAQVPAVNLIAVVTGRTDPDAFPAEQTLGANRTSGPSRFRADGGFQIAAAVICPLGTVAVASLQHPAGHPVTFYADDDVSDGFGEVSPTDDARQFEGTDVIGGGAVRARILGGRFHRLLGLVDVDLTLDVRVTDAGGTQLCHDAAIPVRITFILMPDVLNLVGGAPLSGFLLVGALVRHGYVEGDRTSIARTVCGLISPFSTRVTDPQGEGNPLHPCPAEGQA